MLHGLASHILSAADLPAARDWYAGVLGQAASFDFRVPPLGATVVSERPLAAADGALAPVDQLHRVTVPLPRTAAWRRWTEAGAIRGWLGVPCNPDGAPLAGSPWPETHAYFAQARPRLLGAFAASAS